MKVSVNLPEPLVARLVIVGEGLGLNRSECLRYLITSALSVEQYKGAVVSAAKSQALLSQMVDFEKLAADADQRVADARAVEENLGKLREALQGDRPPTNRGDNGGKPPNFPPPQPVRDPALEEYFRAKDEASDAVLRFRQGGCRD
jgi:Arc/MetJ-type ribon-helix-helix transcriptional regulator